MWISSIAIHSVVNDNFYLILCRTKVSLNAISSPSFEFEALEDEKPTWKLLRLNYQVINGLFHCLLFAQEGNGRNFTHLSILSWAFLSTFLPKWSRVCPLLRVQAAWMMLIDSPSFFYRINNNKIEINFF
jgi:hypothetical protein